MILLLVYLGPSLVVWTISKGVVKSKGLAWTLILFSSLGGAFIFLNIAGHQDGLGPRSVANLNSSVEYKAVNNLEDLNSELSLSAVSGRPVLLEFYADWCVECKRMESRTFADAKVVDSLKKYTLVRIDITDNTKDHREILGHFNLFGPPALLFFSKNQSRETERLIGFVNSKKLMKTLSLVLGEEF